jgi:hypothetical protein
MAVALALIVLLGVGLPAGGWLLTRRKKFGSRSWPAWLDGRSELDELDQWLADRYQLGADDRDRVCAAVMRGTAVPPHLDAPVRGLVAAAVGGQFRTVRRARWRFRLTLVAAAAYLPVFAGTILLPRNLGLHVATIALSVGALVMYLSFPRSGAQIPVWPGRIRRNSERALSARALGSG